ncbi:unnamed protein product [Somion occarium]|uniref:Protein kinase domain-containing protein n=1 Tax=Somion occarium TaxID=3059160 RepID=A0ABP1CFW2_9APHY
MSRNRVLQVEFRSDTVHRLTDISASKEPDLLAVFPFPRKLEISDTIGCMMPTVSRARLSLLNPPQNKPNKDPILVALMWARGPDKHDALLKKWCIYKKKLADLQGDVIPICHGLFTALYGDVRISCLVLEWCIPFLTIYDDGLSQTRLEAVRKLHARGICHGALQDRRNFRVGSDGKIRIIGFGKATEHKCPNAIPSKSVDRIGRICQELDEFESSYYMPGTICDFTGFCESRCSSYPHV